MRMGDRLEHLRQRPGIARLEKDAPDGHALPRDARLAQDAAPIGQLGAEPHGVERRRQDGTPHGQHLAGDANRVEEVARDLGEGGEEEVTEAVARELPLAREAELEELRHQRLDLGQRDETVPDVARRQHLELVAEPPGAAPVVGHGDDGRQRRHAAAEVALERRQDHREAGAAADRDDPAPAVVPPARRHVFDFSARGAAAPRAPEARAATRGARRTPAAGAPRSGATRPVVGWVNPSTAAWSAWPPSAATCATNSGSGRHRPAPAIGPVADDGGAQMGEVHADLVRAARPQGRLQQRERGGAREPLEDPVARERGPTRPGGAHGHPQPVAGVASDRGLDHARRVRQPAVHQRQVAPLDGPRLELAGQRQRARRRSWRRRGGRTCRGPAGGRCPGRRAPPIPERSGAAVREQARAPASPSDVPPPGARRAPPACSPPGGPRPRGRRRAESPRARARGARAAAPRR